MRKLSLLGVILFLCVSAAHSKENEGENKKVTLSEELDISFTGLPAADQAQMCGIYAASPKDGAIRLPFVGALKIEGKTLSEVEERIVEVYQKQFPALEVTVVRLDEVRALALEAAIEALKAEEPTVATSKHLEVLSNLLQVYRKEPANIGWPKVIIDEAFFERLREKQQREEQALENG